MAKTRPQSSTPPSEPISSAPANFESMVRELGTIVDRLEQGDLPLEESLKLFERGVHLSREAQSRIDTAERRVEELLGFDEHGRPLTRPIDPPPSSEPEADET